MTLCLSRYRWAEFKKTKSGVKLHLRLKFDGDVCPDKAMITPAKTADRKLLEELVVEENLSKGEGRTYARIGFGDYMFTLPRLKPFMKHTNERKEMAVPQVSTDKASMRWNKRVSSHFSEAFRQNCKQEPTDRKPIEK